MSGAELMDAVAELAQLLGWKVAHFAPARTAKGWRTPCRYDAKGFVDLFMVRPGRVLAVEIKGDGDRLRLEQHEWLNALHLAGVEVDVWNSADWLSGRCERALRREKAAA